MTPADLSVFANERIPERPAYPKRIEVLPAIPVTAVGKVYKPQLRMLATQHVLTQRLASSGMDQAVDVSVDESARGLTARFLILSGSQDPSIELAVNDIMKPFALSYVVHGTASEVSA